MKKTDMYTNMVYARAFSTRLNEDLESMLVRHPTPQDRCIFLEDWGPGLVEELGLVWRSETINIV